MKFLSTSPKDTKQIAAQILENIQTNDREGALVLALSGELGAGKTNFVQGVAQYLGIERNVTSPTFVLMKRYNTHRKGVEILENQLDSAEGRGVLGDSKTPRPSLSRRPTSEGKSGAWQTLHHIDCYRIHSPQEILDLEWKDITSHKENLVLVEWAERIKDIVPKDAVWIKFENKGKNKREIMVEIEQELNRDMLK